MSRNSSRWDTDLKPANGCEQEAKQEKYTNFLSVQSANKETHKEIHKLIAAND